MFEFGGCWQESHPIDDEVQILLFYAIPFYVQRRNFLKGNVWREGGHI